ncbi:hypothetical protein [Methanohalophilus halophilus]|uniref:Uncharacterized protein n=1 Tax=Methanohalophilus halophilus TaxID=2177 RepID=A0A1L3Q3N4_9EURY|nr:hypothetical protein [Methanohalophilus halophilus]APH39478.1 hypothetical protein BHR79_08295 [Methanohalophilus halophilus]RNI07260.1 hypothetical protein EFE40_10330 [Methanohalophilus halophilus]SDW27408.1 hypothetical protein SAMN04515625_0567 [Methanohalophilus halophilus]
MEWKVELTGDNKTLERLSLVFNEEIAIFKEDETYLLTANQINSTNDHIIAKSEVQKLLDRINSLAKICLNISENVDYTFIYYVDEKGHKHYFSKPVGVTLTCRYDIQEEITRSDGTIEVYNPAVKIKDWIDVADGDVCVKKILGLIQHDFSSWEGLYKVVEVLQKDDEYPPVTRNGKYYKDIKLFNHTANSYLALKEKARHAKNDTNPPEKPMELIYAQN